MGYTQARLTLVTYLSANNSERDITERQLWEEFKQELQQLIDKHHYAELDIEVV